jgi:hypothetical protein
MPGCGYGMGLSARNPHPDHGRVAALEPIPGNSTASLRHDSFRYSDLISKSSADYLFFHLLHNTYSLFVKS